MNRQKLLRISIVLAALIVFPLYAIKVYLKPDYTDFMVYYRAASRMKDQMWGLVYTLSDGTSPFRYPPILLPLFRPFADLTLKHAQMIWYFLQYIWFALGFGVLYRAARLISPERAVMATSLSILFVLRFCLDTFTIGQVSSLMFLGYCIGFYGYVSRNFLTSGSGLVIPTLFKIGPGFSYLLFPFSKLDHWIRAWLAPVFWTIVLTFVTVIMVGGFRTFGLLGSAWVRIVASDDAYYDASHYGSQSLKSVLLRSVNQHWISSTSAYLIWGTTTVVGCAAILWVWANRRPKLDPRIEEGRGLLFAVGIFPYLWFMPETFKYSLTVLAIPVLMLFLSRENSKLRWTAIVSGFALLSLAGKDLMPDVLFFGLQKASFPFLATLIIGAATLQILWKQTVSWKDNPLSLPRPWENLPVQPKHEGVSVLIPLSGEKPGRETLKAVDALQRVLQAKFGTQWELIFIAPMTSPGTRVEDLTQRFPQSKIVSSADPGRGYCLREGFLQSSGKWIYLYRLEQPVAPSFFENAMEDLKNGFQLVRGNRRDPDSRFLIPVKHLRLAYGRHRMGIRFNRLVRLLLPVVSTTDTHSGHVVLTRQSAAQIFALQTSGDFLFDLELAVTAKAHGFREKELPVSLYVFEEKSSGRILAEVLSILTGLPRLRKRLGQGCYSPLNKSELITADDWGLSPAINSGILDLARKGVIRRVSLMASCSFLEEGLKELATIPGIRLGLHFNLTYGRPISPAYRTMPPSKLLVTWLNPFGDRKGLTLKIQTELRAQIEALKKLGIPINYFDGHHHIHLIPGLFEHLAPILDENGIRVVRIPYDPDLKFSKKFPLVLLSLLAARSVRKHGFESTKVFYPQRIHFQDHGRMRAKLNLNPSAEVIVHPADHNDMDSLEFPDSYTDGRVDEFRALQMMGFTQGAT